MRLCRRIKFAISYKGSLRWFTISHQGSLNTYSAHVSRYKYVAKSEIINVVIMRKNNKEMHEGARNTSVCFLQNNCGQQTLVV
jgi:hypothetical protein